MSSAIARPAVILDYDTFKAALSGGNASVILRLRRARDESRVAGVSAVLWFAAGKAWQKAGRKRLLDAFLQPSAGLDVIEFDRRMSQLPVDILRDTDRLDDLDAISIATAKVTRRPLAVLDRRLYSAIPKVTIEDWSKIP